MKNAKFPLFLFPVFLFLNFCSVNNEKNQFWEEGRVTIAGKVKNFERHRDHKTIQIIIYNLFNTDEGQTAIIDDKGNFKIDFTLEHPQEFYLNYGKLCTLFCSPGDTLYLEIDSDVYNDDDNEGKPNGQYFVKIVGGTSASLNRNLIKFLENIPNEKYSYQYDYDAVAKKSPDEYTSYVLQREKEYTDYLIDFNKKNITGELFKKWAKDNLRHESFNDLIQYRWRHIEYRGVSKDSFNLSESYFSFLDNYNMNDSEVLSINHTFFLQEYSRYSREVPKDSLKKAIEEYKNKNLLGTYRIIINMIKENASGFTQEFILSDFYISILDAYNLKEFETLYDPSEISVSCFKHLIKSKHIEIKNFLANQNTEGANLVDLNSEVTSEIIQEIISKYKGKVIYIDFWAPWCHPCLEEMPHSKEIQNFFKNKDVAFLFLANRCKDDSWKATIANKKLTGDHIKLTDDQYNVLKSKLGISGIPHYSLINKKGQIVFKDAPRPSQKEKLIKEIEKLLNE